MAKGCIHLFSFAGRLLPQPPAAGGPSLGNAGQTDRPESASDQQPPGLAFLLTDSSAEAPGQPSCQQYRPQGHFSLFRLSGGLVGFS